MHRNTLAAKVPVGRSVQLAAVEKILTDAERPPFTVSHAFIPGILFEFAISRAGCYTRIVRLRPLRKGALALGPSSKGGCLCCCVTPSWHPA